MNDIKCPHCDKIISISSNVHKNMESYGKLLMVNTLCCGKPVNLSPRTTFTATKYIGTRIDDDWGNPINSSKR